MFSQHPDHARAPFWQKQPLILTAGELEECFLMWKDLGADEVMWDWEGKLVDEAVIERLLGEHLPFFKRHPLGKELFLTFRVPNSTVEPGYRLGRAFMVMLSAAETARHVGLPAPLFEVILPMTENSAELLALHEGYARFADAADATFGGKRAERRFEVIPLFERVRTIFDSAKIVRHYANTLAKRSGRKLQYIRPFVARSDPALNSGIVATTLAIKRALSEFARFSEETGIETHPIIAPGSLPFRGYLTPRTARQFADEFKGVRTVVIQSAFRYDYPKRDVIRGIRELKARLGEKPAAITPAESRVLSRSISAFEHAYRAALREAAPPIQELAPQVPRRRERMQHIGLFGYSRGVGSLRLPRAIGFTAAAYSLGIPPELFGIGRAIARAKREGTFPLIEERYVNLGESLREAGRFFRRASLSELRLSGLAKDVELLEEHSGPIGPDDAASREHERIAGAIVRALRRGKSATRLIEEAALIRKALG